MKAKQERSLGALTSTRLFRLGGILLAVTIVTAVVCSLFGPMGFSWGMAYRLQRLAAAAMVGSALAAGGMGLQAILRNPLAEPYLLGISSGAGVGVLAGMSLLGSVPAWLAWSPIPLLAFIGALATCTAVYLIAQRRGRLDAYSLILSGVIVNVFNGALMLVINLYIKPYQIIEFSRWMMGEVSENVNRGTLIVCCLCIMTGWLVLLLRSADFNALALGDDVARSVGVSVARIRLETFLCVSLMAGAAVALAGPVGFIGLIVPHICRMLMRADFRVLVIASGFIGAIFLMIVETLCYSLAQYAQVAVIPVGIVTALCGGPFFLVLLRRRFQVVEA